MGMIRRDLEAGDHLVGVYGDNWLRAASFSLMAIPLSSKAKEEEESVQNVDAQLVAQREQLKAFKVICHMMISWGGRRSRDVLCECASIHWRRE